jgi:leucyl aminopeptidase
MINSVEAPFGGAVTAALFLESFVKEKPWAHLDVYAWKDGADGAWSEGGGSGQAVLGLIQFLLGS